MTASCLPLEALTKGSAQAGRALLYTSRAHHMSPGGGCRAFFRAKLHTWIFACLWLPCFSGIAPAQCPHDPTISPSGVILCPNSQDTLWTQVYDTYQWYKDGNLIPGAVNPYYVVDYFLDGGSYFSVEATLNGCAELSLPVLVDGWAFLPVTVQTIGYKDTLCLGDTLWLVLNLPYDTLIQWTNNGVPIPGANGDTLVVTMSGSYSVSAAPSLCPGYIQPLGLNLGYNFINCMTGIVEGAASVPSAWFFQGQLQIDFGNGTAGPAEIRINDLSGKVVWHENVQSPAGLTRINHGRFRPGVYVISIISREGVISRRVPLLPAM